MRKSDLIIAHIDTEKDYATARKSLLDWAAAHAGPNRSQARRSLRSQNQYASYEKDRLRITARQPAALRANEPEIRVYTINIDDYTAVGCIGHFNNDDGKYNFAYVAMTTLTETELPWDAEPVRNAITPLREMAPAHQLFPANQSRALNSPGNPEGIVLDSPEAIISHAAADYLAIITPSGDEDSALQEYVAEYAPYLPTAHLSHHDLLSLLRQLPADQLSDWVNAKWALAYPPDAGEPPSPPWPCHINLAPNPDHLNYLIIEAKFRNTIGSHGTAVANLLSLLSWSASAPAATAPGVPPPPTPAPPAEPLLQELAARNHELELERDQARAETAKLRAELELERDVALEDVAKLQSEKDNLLAALQGLPAAAEPPLADDNAAGDAERSRRIREMAHDLGRYGNLRFLPSAHDSLAAYKQERPTIAELDVALLAMDSLAAAYRAAPNGAIGDWKEYFSELTGWRYAAKESSATLGKHRKQREFKDPATGAVNTYQRHLTYTVNRSGCQIYFEAGAPGGQPFVVAYIGEYLPNAGKYL